MKWLTKDRLYWNGRRVKFFAWLPTQASDGYTYWLCFLFGTISYQFVCRSTAETLGVYSATNTSPLSDKSNIYRKIYNNIRRDD